MASATPASTEQAPQRPLSFAKVAASAIKPQISKDSAPKARPPVATPRVPTIAQKPRAVPNGEAPKSVMEKQENNNASKSAENAASQPVLPNDKAESLPAPPVNAKAEVTDRPQCAAVAKVSAPEDSNTQLSSSDGSGKPPSLDGKSVASATTFALDEKESLRPDDSASLRAVEEEDIISPPDSVIADSRQGSDHGAARAFRDQLQEIAVMNPQPHRGVPPGRFPTMPIGPQTLYDPNQSLNGSGPMPQPLVNGMAAHNGAPNMPAIPDEKLLEALRSPRDRLFVVKIEQDFIDFIKDSRENELCLPNCNTFYRMLAHRLADYYLLGHVVDTTMTGVKITRTPYCRIPPPVSQMVDPAKGTNTPPVELPARKIMRRDGGKSGTNTGANSQSASKTTSEMGGSEGSNDEVAKDKTALSREEREARYREARQRIFGSAESEETDAADANGSGEDKEKGNGVSRSSSVAGKKKPKKQRNYDDDDFQARSRFNVYYSQQYPVAAYAGDNAVYYNGFPGPSQNPPFAAMNPGASPSTTYSTPYPGMMNPDGQPQYGWNGQQYQPPSGSMMMYPGYGQGQNGYDLSADFQRGMSSFQNAGLPSQVTPKMANPQMASYQDTYQQPQHMPMNSGWPQANQQPSYPMAQNNFGAPSGPGNRPMSAPHQGPMPGYPYGQFPSNAYNGKPNRNQHPIPGSYNRGQFNPQTQAFVPGGRNMPFGMQPNMMQAQPPMNGYGGYQMSPQTSMPAQMPRHNASTNSTPSFGSPQSMQGHASAPTMNRIASQPGDPGSSQSSIAKYGTPAHLPPKPPAPAPAPPFALPSMTRVPSSGVVNGAPGMPSRAGSASFNNNNNNHSN